MVVVVVSLLAAGSCLLVVVSASSDVCPSNVHRSRSLDEYFASGSPRDLLFLLRLGVTKQCSLLSLQTDRFFGSFLFAPCSELLMLGVSACASQPSC